MAKAARDPWHYSLAIRKPKRVTITVPWMLFQRMIQESDEQGRSLSSLACHWLEVHLRSIEMDMQ